MKKRSAPEKKSKFYHYEVTLYNFWRNFRFKPEVKIHHLHLPLYFHVKDKNYLYKAERHSKKINFDQYWRYENDDEKGDSKFCTISTNVPIGGARGPDAFKNITIPTNCDMVFQNKPKVLP